MAGYPNNPAIQFPWISVTGISTVMDAHNLAQAIECTSPVVPVVCGIGGSYKRLQDFSLKGAHSAAIRDLPDILNVLSSVGQCNFSLHLSPNDTGGCYDDCMRYLEILQRQVRVLYLQITMKWPSLCCIQAIRKNFPQMGIALQVPLYKMVDLDMETIGTRIKCYSDIVSSMSLDYSGGQGRAHNCAYSKRLLAWLHQNKVTLQPILAGGIDAENVESYLLDLYGAGYICAVDSQSKLQVSLQLDEKKTTSYLRAASKAYRIIEISKSKEIG